MINFIQQEKYNETNINNKENISKLINTEISKLQIERQYVQKAFSILGPTSELS